VFFDMGWEIGKMDKTFIIRIFLYREKMLKSQVGTFRSFFGRKYRENLQRDFKQGKKG
jgi:hypothetical protein